MQAGSNSQKDRTDNSNENSGNFFSFGVTLQYATICPYHNIHNNILLLVVSRGALQPATAGAKPPFADVAVEIEGEERIYASVPDARRGCLVTTAASAGLQQTPFP